MILVINLPRHLTTTVVEQTRCSAIAERPRCRERYSFCRK